MHVFWQDFGLLLAIDLVLFCAIRGVAWIEWQAGHGETPLWVALPCALGAIAAHFAASLAIFGPDLLGAGMPLHVAASVVGGLLPVMAALWMLSASWVGANTNAIHGWDRRTPYSALENDWSRARSMKRNRDFAGAMRQYRRYFEENPICPRPLFEAELMLESERHYERALDLLREILRRFGDNDVHWVEAIYRMAHVLEVQQRDFETSHYLLRKIIERCPDSDYAKFAKRLLDERKSNTSTTGAA